MNNVSNMTHYGKKKKKSKKILLFLKFADLRVEWNLFPQFLFDVKAEQKLQRTYVINTEHNIPPYK